MPLDDGVSTQLPLLDWLPDETCFSLASRHHYIWGYASSESTCELLFAHARGGVLHDLPNNLGTFVERTNGRVGDIGRIAREHTLLRFYQAFLSVKDREDAVNCLAGSNVALLKLRLGILSSRFRASHPLKACLACINEDVENVGWAYWHLRHQHPGVWVCTKHRQLLSQSVYKSTGLRRFNWLLPSCHLLQSAVEGRDSIPDKTFALLWSLAQLIDEIVEGGAIAPLLSPQLNMVYLGELARRGWVTHGGYLRLAQISSAFLEYVGPLGTVAEFARLPIDMDAAAMQLGRLLHPSRTGTHPLSHLLVIHWLFGSASKFKEAQSNTLQSQKVRSFGFADCLQPAGIDVISQLGRGSSVDGTAVVNQACGGVVSETKAATMQGVDAVIAGLEVSSPKLPAIDAAASRKLRRGKDATEIAAQTGISLEAISQIVLSEDDACSSWHQAQKAKTDRGGRERAIWLSLLEASGFRGITWMIKKAPSTHTWLYRNDRIWLDKHKPPFLPKGAKVRGVTVDWEARDKLLSDLVRDTTLLLLKEQGARRIFFWQLYQKIPELLAKRDSLHRLPLTQQAIRDALVAHQCSMHMPD